MLLKRRRLVNLVSALTLLLVLTCSAFFFVPTKKAEAASCGDVLVSGSSWLGGNGVDIHSNGGDEGTGTSCAGSVYNLNASPPQMGSGWQCVEFVQRLYKTRGWVSYNAWPNVATAADIYTQASNLGMTATANDGSIILSNIVPGDMIVTHEDSGHVMVVDYISGNTIHYADQNGKDGGMGTATYDPNTKKISAGSYYQISGIVHSPKDTLTSGGSSGSTGNTVLAVKKLTQSDGTNEVFWAKGTNTFETWWRGDSGPQTSSLVYIPQGDIKAIDAQLMPDGLHLIYTATTNYIWQTAWYPGQQPSTGLLLHSPGNIRAIQKTIGPDGVTHQMYVLTDSGVSEYWWNSTSNGIQGGSLYTLANPVAMYKTLEPDGTQVVYIADANYAYMVRWGGSVGSLQVSTITNISNITAISFSEDSDGKHRLYVGSSSGGIWEISWYVPGSYSTWYMVGGAPVVALQKWESDSTQVLYEATSGGVFEYYWLQTSNASLAGDTIVGSLSSVHAFVRTTDPNGVQSVYTATGTNVLETWWIPGGNGPTTGTVA